MEKKAPSSYTAMSDKQLVEMTVSNPHDEKAVVYLLYERYKNLLYAIFLSYKPKDDCFDDCLQDLYILLKGTRLNWQPLASFEWRSTFGCWLRKIAVREFPKTIRRMETVVEHGTFMESIDSDAAGKAPRQIADGGGEDEERRIQMVLLVETIGRLADADRRFVILKRLEGYRSKEIAVMLQQKWLKHGIVKYNNKGCLVVPDEDYVNVCTQRAKAELKRMFAETRF